MQKVFRIVDAQFKDDLSGQGAKIYGGRWNPKGVPVLYASEHISLCMLENMVYMAQDLYRRPFHLLTLQIPLETVQDIDEKRLKRNWIKDMEYTQWLGSQFFQEDGFVLKVPSAIVKEEFNFVINTNHIHFKKVKIIENRLFYFDERLFS